MKLINWIQTDSGPIVPDLWLQICSTFMTTYIVLCTKMGKGSHSSENISSILSADWRKRIRKYAFHEQQHGEWAYQIDK